MEVDLRNLSVLVSCYNKSGDFAKFKSNVLQFIRANAEICIIDDGSTDESCFLLEEFAKTNKNIVFSSRSNRGSGSTRNELIGRASRKYLIFLDMDDELEIQAVVNAVRSLEEKRADISVCNFFNVRNNEKGNMPIKTKEASVVKIEEITEDIWQILGFWRYVYRREFLIREDIIFFPTFLETKGRYFIFDDMFFLSQLATSSGRAVVMPHTEIIYRYHAPEFDKSAQNRFRTQLSLVPEFALEFLKEKDRKSASKKSMILVARYVHFASSNLYINKFIQSLPHLLDFALRENATGQNYLEKLRWLMEALRNSFRLTLKEIQKALAEKRILFLK